MEILNFIFGAIGALGVVLPSLYMLYVRRRKEQKAAEERRLEQQRIAHGLLLEQLRIAQEQELQQQQTIIFHHTIVPLLDVVRDRIGDKLTPQDKRQLVGACVRATSVGIFPSERPAPDPESAGFAGEKYRCTFCTLDATADAVGCCPSCELGTRHWIDWGATDTGTKEFEDFIAWAGAQKATLAFVFTDVLNSTALGVDLGDELMDQVRRAHFEQGTALIRTHEAFVVKTIGDAFLAAFRSAVDALKFALALHAASGDERVEIRAGIHVGPIRIENRDAFGTILNFASRVGNRPSGAEIWVSNRVKEDLDLEKPAAFQQLEWGKHPNCKLKGFPGRHTLWSVRAPVPCPT